MGGSPEVSSSEAERNFETGAELLGEDKGEDAIAEFDEAIRLDPELATAYMARGSIHAGLGQYDRAVADYAEFIRLNPEHGNACVARADVYMELGLEAKAQKDMKRASELRALPP